MSPRSLPSQPHRASGVDREIHRYLADRECAPPREIVRAVSASRSTVSHRLGLLVAAGHVVREGQSWNLLYRVGPVPLPLPEDDRPVACDLCCRPWQPRFPADSQTRCDVCRSASRALERAAQLGVGGELIVTTRATRVRAVDPRGRPAWLDVPADADWLHRELAIAAARVR